MGVWSFEAADISDADELATRPIYRTPAIDAFLGFEKSQKRIISGLKGTGKTLFLKLISHHYRRSGITAIPRLELTERLYSIDHDFSSERAKVWASHERWKQVWRTVLAVVVLKAVGRQLPSEIIEIFPEGLGLSVGSHLSAAVRNRAVHARHFQEVFSDKLDAEFQTVNQAVAVFVDNVDEALARHSGYDLYRASLEPRSQEGAHSYALWLSAQIGFILAVRELTARNAHVKLYGTVRAEAIRDNPTPTAFNAQAMVLDLRYTAADLRGIFTTKLERLLQDSRGSFCRPHEPDALKAFFQTDTIEHRSVVTEDGRPYVEDTFDYLRRHTRGRPRELDFIGYGLQMVRPEYRTPDRIRDLVRDQSNQFYRYAQNEAVPYWDPRLDKLLDRIPSNFISRRQAVGISNRLFGKEVGTSLWSTLYANGLCGAVVSDYPTGTVQRFSSHDGTAELSELDFAQSRTLILHPCVNIATRSRRTRYKPNRRNVAGHVYPFVPESKQKKHLHLLVGGGKLGLGLVVPLLLTHNSTCVIIAARLSDTWSPLSDATRRPVLRIKHLPERDQRKEDTVIALAIVSDRQANWQATLETARKRSRCVVFIYENAESFKHVVRLAESIGVSVGRAFREVVTDIARSEPRCQCVIAFENDDTHLPVAAKILRQTTAIPVATVVDRICSQRTIGTDGIIVTAETHGSITLFLEDKHLKRSIPPAFASKDDRLKLVLDRDAFAFVREKKKRLVNSLHTAAAALVLRALFDVNARTETADEALLGLVANNMDINTELVAVKELLILSVLGSLPSNRLKQPDVRDLIFELNEFGDRALKRMQGPDAPSRVLAMEVEALALKHRRLFSDVPSLALEALRYPLVREMIGMTPNEVRERIGTLNDAFMNIVGRLASERNRA